ncbi:uncharacterized protein LOC108118171 [Drosophila eugracilis]|uniref:uncharacterized protein LOC108118171 n=1 Tax=Drosophila eugracilis TaxID=29029 RepID=UPI0007E60E7B|nr:uncharacterized protein LOC108118171 [Drosophila eugracilis]
MLKINLLFAFVCLFVAIQAQTPRPADREICRIENEKCKRNERRLGRDNDISNIFNEHCRRSGITNWRSVSRCELSLATCRLTLERCSTISCENVRRSLSAGGPPTPRTTTPTPAIPDTRGPRRTTTRRTPTPATRRTTTRRTPTPATRRTTTRRTTTRRGNTRRTTTTRRTRTTTRQPSED